MCCIYSTLHWTFSLKGYQVSITCHICTGIDMRLITIFSNQTLRCTCLLKYIEVQHVYMHHTTSMHHYTHLANTQMSMEDNPVTLTWYPFNEYVWSSHVFVYRYRSLSFRGRIPYRRRSLIQSAKLGSKVPFLWLLLMPHSNTTPPLKTLF